MIRKKCWLRIDRSDSELVHCDVIKKTNLTDLAPSPEDRALFREAVKGVKRLRSNTQLVRNPPPKAAPRPRLHASAGPTLHEPSSGELNLADQLEYKRIGVQPALWRRLRRGEFALEETLDLHGVTIAEAREQLAEFLHECVTAGYKCVRIVHGKGYRSPAHAAVLKPRVAYWLAHASEVVAYVSARPADGGTGALYVLLKRSPEQCAILPTGILASGACQHPGGVRIVGRKSEAPSADKRRITLPLIRPTAGPQNGSSR